MPLVLEILKREDIGMSNNYYYLLSCIALGAILTSCSKDDLGEISPEIESNVIITTEFPESNAGGADTRSSIGGENGLEFTWAKGDQLKVSSTQNSLGIQFTLQTSDIGNQKGNFKGRMTAKDEYVSAIYPNIQNVNFSKISNNRKYTFTIPITQTQTHLSNGTINPESLGKYAFMYGKTSNRVSTPGAGSTTTSFDLKMQHLMTIFDFNLTNITEGEKVESVTLRSNSKISPTTAIVTFPTTEDATTVAYGTGICKNITVNIEANDNTSGVLAQGRALTVRLATLPTDITSTDVWYIDVVTNNRTYTFIKEQTKNQSFAAGKRYKAPLDLASIIDKSVSLNDATSLASVITEQEEKTIGSLTISGTANLTADDFLFMRDKMLIMTKLDISKTATTTIPQNAFYISEDTRHPLSEIILPESLEEFGAAAFKNTRLKSINIPASVTKMGNYMFHLCDQLTTVTLSNKRIGLATGMFRDCASLTSINSNNDYGVYLPNITGIGNYCFSGCKALKSIHLPLIKRIFLSAFSGCSSLIEIDLDALETVNNNAFASCTSLTSIEFPATITTLGDNVFKDCTSLKAVTFLTETAPTISTTTFSNSITEIIVPSAAAKTAYAKAKIWVDLAAKLTYLGE